MSRVDLQKIRMSSPEEFLTYNELNTSSFIQLIKKWFRNYKHGAKLPFYRAHKDYYYYGISLFAVLVAFNWNRVIAAWDRESIFFIPNITTISAISIFTIYIILLCVKISNFISDVIFHAWKLYLITYRLESNLMP